MRDVADVAFFERLDPVSAVRAEHRDVDLAREHVLPFVGVGVPVQFAEPAGLEFEDDAGDGRRDRELVRPRPATRGRPCGSSAVPA